MDVDDVERNPASSDNGGMEVWRSVVSGRGSGRDPSPLLAKGGREVVNASCPPGSLGGDGERSNASPPSLSVQMPSLPSPSAQLPPLGSSLDENRTCQETPGCGQEEYDT